MPVEYDTCINEHCSKIENMGWKNYCIHFCSLYANYNSEGALIGPILPFKKIEIKIGTLTDPDCWSPLLDSESMGDFLYDSDGNKYKLSIALLKQIHFEG